MSRVLKFVGATLTEVAGEAVVTISGGGGGTLDHASLTSGLAWLASQHTLSAARRLAASGATSAAAEVTYTAYTETLLDDPDAVTARATLGLEIGVDVPSYSDPRLSDASTSQKGIVQLATDGEESAEAVLGTDGRLLRADPSRVMRIEIVPSNSSIVTTDSNNSSRSLSAGNTAARRATTMSGVTADFFTNGFAIFRTGWTYVGDASFATFLTTGSSVAATCRYKMGIVQTGFSTTDSETAGRSMAMFRYITGLGHTTWMCFSQNASASEETSSGVAVAANTEVHLEVRVNASYHKFYINGALVATHTTRLMSSTADLGYQCGNYATSRTLYFTGGLFLVRWS